MLAVCRVVTGNLRPTPLSSLYRVAGIAPPDIRRDTSARTEKFKQEIDERHPLYGHVPETPRLKSRKSFMTRESLIVYRLGGFSCAFDVPSVSGLI